MPFAPKLRCVTVVLRTGSPVLPVQQEVLADTAPRGPPAHAQRPLTPLRAEPAGWTGFRIPRL